ncbi:glycoside hydrolase family 5 protein [Victivallis vadensis]|uniref:glycoside hydrolase family 5 protein n=1 Tax=Victivallis vadensis TaxID=172901 RepID=UPI0023F040A0|nr:glycoside hydrolase family 5 protein [Victivallis vadensis]
MKTTLAILAVAMAAATLGAASLMPVKGKISIAAGDGASFKQQENILVLQREQKGVGMFLQGMIRFNPPMDGKFAEDDALVLKIRTAKDTRLNTRWRRDDKVFCHTQDYPVAAGKDFQEIVMPLPNTYGHSLTTLFLQFQPDPGKVEIADIAVAKPSKVLLTLNGNPAKFQKMIHFTGKVLTEAKSVDIAIRNSKNKVFTKTVPVKNGKFELKWKNPPTNLYTWNQAYAQISGSDKSSDRSMEHQVFGYLADDEFVWLKVKGKNIVTSPRSKDGEQNFIPVGIGYCRDVIIPAQDDEVMKFCRERGLNTIRLSFYTRFFNNRDSEPLNIDEHIRDFILPVVQAAKRNNMYVILDDHGYFSAKIDEAKARAKQTVPRWSDAGFQEWTNRWVEVAKFFKDEPTVLGYELLNEPHDIPPAEAARRYTQTLKAIREVDTRHIILVGNSDWSHARAIEKTWGETAKTVDAPYNNVVFSFHDYPDDNHPWIVAGHITSFRDKYNVPVLCTEFGATHWNKSETACRSFISGMMALFAKEDVGWMIWALKRLEDNPRTPLVKPTYDSCCYSDIWIPTARIMASPFPKRK